MIKSQSIAEIMLKHHFKIDKLLHKIKEELDHDNKTLMGNFNNFKWEMEKHFFLEEKAIFQLHYSENQESNKIKTQLKEEHNILRKQLDDIEKGLINEQKIEFFEFRKFLINHKNFENNVFYPRLDNELDDVKKNLIIDRLTSNF